MEQRARIVQQFAACFTDYRSPLAHDAAPSEIVLDLDATDDPLHGNQEARFFHGHYKGYCYLPLYIFCGEFLLCAKLRLFADRTRTHYMGSNQIRRWFSSVAYVFVQTLRRVGLKGTKLAKAQCHTIRLKLLKIGAVVRLTVRKVWLSFSEAYPYADLFGRVVATIRQWRPLRC